MTQEEIKQAINEWWYSQYIKEQATFEDCFVAGAVWADKTMLNKACEWLEDNYPYWFDTDMEEQFKKAIKGEEE